MRVKDYLAGTAEKDIKATVLAYLKMRGFRAWNNPRGVAKMTNGGAFVRYGGPPGCSDIIGFMPPDGRFIAVETKAAKNSRIAAAQQEFIDMVKEGGGIGVIAKSLEDVINAVQAERYEEN